MGLLESTPESQVVEEEVSQPEIETEVEAEEPATTTVNEGIASTQTGPEEEPVVEEEPVEEPGEPEEENPYAHQYSDNQHLIMEYARNQYPTYKLLHQYAVGPGCGPIRGLSQHQRVS